MPVAIFSRSEPNRNSTHVKWFEQLRIDHLRLKSGVAHELKMPEFGIAQLCKHCRKATRESTWVVRCGPCGELFTPVLTLFVSCEWCGWAEGAMAQLEEHLQRMHSPNST
jgi:hypothetical protein